MSFVLILVGIFMMFGSFSMLVLVWMMGMDPFIYSVIMTVIGIIGGIMLAAVAILGNGIIGPFMKAKMQGGNLIAVITASKKIRLHYGFEKGGLTRTEEGLFLTQPDSMFNWPNGARGCFAHYKYGSTLPPKFVKVCSKLKEKGIRDIKELQVVDELARKESPGKEIELRFDD